jgi:hypothetical protein
MAKLIISNKSRVWVLVAVLIMALMATTATVSAQETNPNPYVRSVSCQIGDQIHATLMEFRCDVDVAGGTPPYSYKWGGAGNVSIQQGLYADHAIGYCYIDDNRSAVIKIKITDSGYRMSDTFYKTFYCRGGSRL